MSTVAVVELVLFLLLAVSIVALITSRLRIPYTVALVFAGVFIDLFHLPIREIAGIHDPSAPLLTPEIIFLLFLPGLLFESGININASLLRKNFGPILMLAVVGVVAATAVTGYAVHHVLGIPVMTALLFGALISATDPISVIALFRDLGANKRLTVLVEGESLFNDGTAAVLFQVILAGIATGQLSVLGGIQQFLTVTLGGAALGLLIGYAASKITEQVDQPSIEITLTTIVAYGSYLAAEHLHVSGVIATVAAGLIVGNYGMVTGMSPRTRVAVYSFWDYFAFVINSIVFLLIGTEVHVTQLFDSWQPIALATGVVILGRAVVVYLLTPLSNRYAEAIPVAWQHVLVWGGLHGSVSLALALSMPAGVEHRNLLLTITLGVVAFSIIVQGLTMRPLLEWLKLSGESKGDYGMWKAKQLALAAGRKELEALRQEKLIGAAAHQELTQSVDAAARQIEDNLVRLQQEEPQLIQQETRMARLRMLNAERSTIQKAVVDGVISAHAAEELLSEAAAQIDELSHEKH